MLKVAPISCHDLCNSLRHQRFSRNGDVTVVEVTVSLIHVFNLLFQGLKLRLIDAGGPFDHRPRHTLTQETLDHLVVF